MRITFLGAAQTVTGSCYLVETLETTFLIDCGMHQGPKSEEQRNRTPFPFHVEDIDFVLLTHAHIDHSGRLPKLFVDGYRKEIYATKATADLCGIMLPDSGHIQEMESEWQERKGIRAGRDPEPPLYTMQDAVDTCRLFHPVQYGIPLQASTDVRVIFRDAGHILGSAILEITVLEAGKETSIAFSGDLGNKGIPIMRDPSVIAGPDTLVLESTYGDRLHTNSVDKVDRFVDIINETIARGGNVVIPSFAIGRTQEILYEIHRESDRYKDKREAFLRTPVYVDSPLATNATRIFEENAECYDEEARSHIQAGDNPLDFPNLHFTVSAEESKQINRDRESKIIISSSGMCDAGRIKHHLKHNLWRKESTILFVGFQAKGTLGRELVDGARTVRIFGEEIKVNARIEMIEGFSGHADRDGLLDWIDAMKHRPERIILVHGEPEVIAEFSKTIGQRFGIPTTIPEFGETIAIGSSPGTSKVVLPLPIPIEGGLREASRILDELQTDLDLTSEELRKRMRTATTQEELDGLLHQMKKDLGKRIDQLLSV